MRRSLAGLGFVAVVLVPAAASAQTVDDYGKWNRPGRPTFESPQNFALEVRFGPYKPDIDSQFPGSKPFQSVFGDGNGLAFGAELDWQALRIPYLGTLGPGFSWSYTHRSAKALLSSDKTPSAENTTLSIMPMSLVAVLRVDVLAREVGIPIVPYGKAGLGFALWSTGNDSGTSTRDGVLGRGRSWGTWLGGGAMLQLDFLDRQAARELDNEIGINHTYFFGEYMHSGLDGISFIENNTMRVGTTEWVLGLAFEM